MEELGGHRSRRGVEGGDCPMLVPQSPSERKAGLTSDQRQPVPSGSPSHSFSLTAPGTPQPSGRGRGQRVCKEQRSGQSAREQEGEYEPSQGRIPQAPWSKENTTKFSISNLLPREPGGQMY